jgi:hypothetical protein
MALINTSLGSSLLPKLSLINSSSKEIILVHVIQIKTPVVQEQKQLHEYNKPNNSFGNQQYISIYN